MWFKKRDRLIVELTWAGDLPMVTREKPFTIKEADELQRWFKAARSLPDEHFENRAYPAPGVA